MIDRSISSNTAAALLLWPIGLILVVVDLVTGWQTGELGLYATGGGAMFTIRGYFCGMHEREREAYRLGQESVRSIH